MVSHEGKGKRYLESCWLSASEESSCSPLLCFRFCTGFSLAVRVCRSQTTTKENICFVAFVDQASPDVILQEQEPNPNANGTFGLWRIVLIKNLPYLDHQHNGKVPKFRTHRLFVKARSYVTGTKRILFLDWHLIFRLTK
jgi:hypothetical protein